MRNANDRDLGTKAVFVASEREVSGRKTGQLLMRQGEEEEGPFGLDVIVLTAHHMNSALNP